MITVMKLLVLLVLLNILGSAVSFVPSVSQATFTTSSATCRALHALHKWHQQQDEHNVLHQSKNSVALLVSSFMLLPTEAVMAADELEIAELPPVWVPVVFGLALLVGVGLLTSSLGNVMDEESSLGMQSGARAKKEAERSRSSYFKK